MTQNGNPQFGSVRFLLSLVGVALIIMGLAYFIARAYQSAPHVQKPPTAVIYRSDADMEYFKQKLAAVQPGDLLVMVPHKVKQLPLMYQVNDSFQHGGIRVVDITGRDPVYAGSIPLTPVSRFIDYHQSIGVVHIISKEKAEAFYRGILSAAAFVAVR
jgi:hypothetical protein